MTKPIIPPGSLPPSVKEYDEEALLTQVAPTGFFRSFLEKIKSFIYFFWKGAEGRALQKANEDIDHIFSVVNDEDKAAGNEGQLDVANSMKADSEDLSVIATNNQSTIRTINTFIKACKSITNELRSQHLNEILDRMSTKTKDLNELYSDEYEIELADFFREDLFGEKNPLINLRGIKNFMKKQFLSLKEKPTTSEVTARLQELYKDFLESANTIEKEISKKQSFSQSFFSMVKKINNIFRKQSIIYILVAIILLVIFI